MSTTAESGFLISEQDRYEYQQSQQRQVKSELDKDAFMHLLMMEMKHQDPLEPISNKEMMGQLTQFTSVEQLQNLNEKFEEFISINSQSKWGQALEFMGKSVRAVTVNGPIEGPVTKATVYENQIILEVEGMAVTLDQVISLVDSENSDFDEFMDELEQEYGEENNEENNDNN